MLFPSLFQRPSSEGNSSGFSVTQSAVSAITSVVGCEVGNRVVICSLIPFTKGGPLMVRFVQRLLGVSSKEESGKLRFT